MTNLQVLVLVVGLEVVDDITEESVNIVTACPRESGEKPR